MVSESMFSEGQTFAVSERPCLIQYQNPVSIETKKFRGTQFSVPPVHGLSPPGNSSIKGEFTANHPLKVAHQAGGVQFLGVAK